MTDAKKDDKGDGCAFLGLFFCIVVTFSTLTYIVGHEFDEVRNRVTSLEARVETLEKSAERTK